jgi:hypothetical protein
MISIWITADMQTSLQPLNRWRVEAEGDVYSKFNIVIIIINNTVALTSYLHCYNTSISYVPCIVSTVINYIDMSIINPLLAVRFDSDPTGKYKEFKIAMETLAGSLCTEIYEHGLAGMGAHLTCTEFASKYPDDDRPTFSKPIKPANTATKVQFELYKEAKEEYGKYMVGLEVIKSYVMDACKSKIMGAMTTTDMPIPMMTITYIVNQLEEAYGTPTTRDVSRLQEDVNKPCKSDEDFLFYVKELKRNFRYLEDKRAEVKQMQLLTAGTATLPNVKRAITRYVVAHPRLAERSFDDMVAYITEELPNFMDDVPSATASAIATTPTLPIPGMKSTAPVTRDELEYCFAQLLIT